MRARVRDATGVECRLGGGCVANRAIGRRRGYADRLEKGGSVVVCGIC